MENNPELNKDSQEASNSIQPHSIPFYEAFKVWVKIALLSFGGPAGQIAIMHKILVEEKRWIGEERFLHALNFCMLLPGPEAQQLATYIGWLLHKTKGGLVAGLLFILPGFVAILLMSYAYVFFGNIPQFEGLLLGLKASVLAIVFQAIIRISSRSLKTKVATIYASIAFVGLFFFKVPFPLIIIAAGVTSYILEKYGFIKFKNPPHSSHSASSKYDDGSSALGSYLPSHSKLNLKWAFSVSSILLFLWLSPTISLFVLLGPENIYTKLSVFFSKMAVVTFGGAYAVLSYVAQEAVTTFHWLSAGEMVDGLGMAETTPGPLIMVVQFVGFIAAYRNHGTIDALGAATLASILVTWVTFVPCFLWIFLGAPFVEKLRKNEPLSSALAGISAAVVGVIANLALWFSIHTLFAKTISVKILNTSFELPNILTAHYDAILLSIISLIAIFKFKLSPIQTITICSIIGFIYRMV